MTRRAQARKRYIDACRARGCGGYLRGVGAEVSDGEIAYCASCGRMHTFHVATNDGPVHVEIERKPRAIERAAVPGKRRKRT